MTFRGNESNLASAEATSGGLEHCFEGLLVRWPTRDIQKELIHHTAWWAGKAEVPNLTLQLTSIQSARAGDRKAVEAPTTPYRFTSRPFA